MPSVLNSPKRECIRLHASIEELDGERVPVYVPRRLPDELIQPLLGHNPGTAGIRVRPMAPAWIRAIHSYTETHWFSAGARSQH